jgi:hypothetical protein
VKRLYIPVAAAVVFAVAPAEAAKDVKRVGVQGGFAGIASEGTFAGYGGGVNFGWSFTDAFTLGVNAMASSNQVTEKGGRSLVTSQAIGVTYALDIIQIVPYAGLYAGLYQMSGGGLDKVQWKGGAQVAVGVDYVYSRDLTFGLEFRAHALPGDFFSSPTNPTRFYATTFLKAEYTWGWF